MLLSAVVARRRCCTIEIVQGEIEAPVYEEGGGYRNCNVHLSGYEVFA